MYCILLYHYTSIAIMVKDYDATFLFYNGAVDMQICALLTRSQCKVSDTQVTVKACGPLVYFLLLVSRRKLEKIDMLRGFFLKFNPNQQVLCCRIIVLKCCIIKLSNT